MFCSIIFNRLFLKGMALVILALMLVGLPGQAALPARAQETPSLLFIENVGQVSDAGVRFQVNLGQMTLHLAEESLWLTVVDASRIDPLTAQAAGPEAQLEASRAVNLKLSFAGANPAPRLEPFNPMDSQVSYFVGRDPANWQSDAPVWGGVRYIELYPGLDLEISGENGQLSQRLVVNDEAAVLLATSQEGQSPTGSPLADVRLQVEGADTVALDDTGHLLLTTPLGEVSFPLLQIVTSDGVSLDLPDLRPEVNDRDVATPFTATPPVPAAPAQVGAAAAEDLIYSTFVGGSGYFDSSQDVAIDETGYAYITGRAYTGFPTTPGVFDPTIEGFFNDAFVAKLSPDGSSLVYATFLGGSAFEWTYAISLDEAGNAYVTGFTGSADFPTTPGAFDDSLSGESDAFVARINTDGTGLLYATLLGGADVDYGQALALDGSGQAYVTGFTRSTDFPTTPDALATGFQGGFSDAFVANIAADGSSLTYATYLGGSADEAGYSIVVDGAANTYLTGYTSSTDFPTTPEAWDSSMAVADAFVVKLNPAGSELVYGTFLGGSMVEAGRAIALDSAGSAYITGRTDSVDFPTTPDGFDTSQNSVGSGDAFVVKLSPDGNGLFYATYLGGNNEEQGLDLAVDAAGSVYITGPTYSTDFPTTPDAFDPTCQSCSQYLDLFVAKLNPNGSGLAYASYLGGEANHDQSLGLAQDGAGYVYLTGEAQSPDFPATAGAFDPTLDGYGNGFVSKLFVGTGLGPAPAPLPEHSCGPAFVDTITVQQSPRGLAVDPERQRLYVANFGSGTVSVVDSSNDDLLQTIPGLDSANGLAYDPSHNLIWVTNYDSDQVTPIQANADATAFAVLPPLAVGNGPWGVAFDPTHNYVYVANSLDNSVSVIDAGGQSLVTTLIGAFNQPFHLAANPTSGKVYVANSGHNSVTVIDGTAISSVVPLWDSGRAYGITVDETRNLVYVATVQTNRIVAIGPLNGQPDKFLGWASFQRGYNRNRPLPLRVIVVNPQMGPVLDGGHVWATTATSDGSEANQALFIPKGWSSRFHVPFPQNVSDNPIEGIAIDRATNRVYISSGVSLGLVTVLGDHPTVCGGIAPANVSPESDEITLELYSVEKLTLSDANGDGEVGILDLALVASRYGSSDPSADLNGDGSVDILDLTLIAGHYGQKLPGFGE